MSESRQPALAAGMQGPGRCSVREHLAAVRGAVAIGIGLALALPSPALARVIWNGDLSPGNLSQYGYVQACPGPPPTNAPPRGATVVSSPTHPGYHYSAKIEVTDASTHANCPTLGSPGNPSAGILSPKLLRPGDEVYIAFSTFFPANFPRDICQPPVSGCFMQVMELYGPPFGGSPPVSIGVVGDRLVFSSSDAGVPGGDIWTSREPIHYGTAWEDIVIHVRCATDGTGFVELWHDGVRQTFVNGRTRYYFPTLEPGVNWNGTANYVDLNQYRGPNPALGDVILYHAAARIATSLPGVLPASRSWNPPLGWWPWMVLAGLGAGSLLGAGLARRRARTRTPGAEG